MHVHDFSTYLIKIESGNQNKILSIELNFEKNNFKQNVTFSFFGHIMQLLQTLIYNFYI